MNNHDDIFGICEHVDLPELGLHGVLAKIDTGAYSGALHCSKIKVVIRKSDGKRVLKFTPSDNHSNSMELTRFVSSYVRSSTGHRVKRYLFDTDIVIKGRAYSIRIGLSNRSDMNYEILIGRRFLCENNILVDARINQEFDIDKEKKS
ncbi:MAG: RimK/LysX family protein [Candidatus Saccharibacteria bacterium]